MELKPAPWPNHWMVNVGLAIGLVFGFAVQTHLQSGSQVLAKETGIPRFVLQLALVFGPLFIAIPITLVFRLQNRFLHGIAALLIGSLAAGYAGIALEFLLWFIGW